MRSVTAYAIGGVLAAGLAAGTAFAPTDPTPSPNTSSGPHDAVASPPLIPEGMTVPSGWRVETYGQTAFAVPATWQNSGPTACRGADILDVRDATRPPRVERSGPVIAIGCPPAESLEHPETGVAGGGTFVSIDDAPVTATLQSPDVKDDRATFDVDGTTYAVQAEPNLRQQILATFTAAPLGANGCNPTSDIQPGDRPAGVGLDAIGTVTRVSACRYETPSEQMMTPCPIVGCGPTSLTEEVKARISESEATATQAPGETTSTPTTPQRLFSSLVLEGEAAQAAVDALQQGPPGNHPDQPQNCAPEVEYGEEMLLVHVIGSGGNTDVVVRYHGCKDRGVDDGNTTRHLTAAGAKAVLNGPNTVLTAHMDMADILMPR